MSYKLTLSVQMAKTWISSDGLDQDKTAENMKFDLT